MHWQLRVVSRCQLGIDITRQCSFVVCNRRSGTAEMPFRCAAAGCRGNYDGEPSVPMVKFPKDPEERQRWIDAMPNDPETLQGRKEIWICMSYFKCDFIISMRPLVKLLLIHFTKTRR